MEIAKQKISKIPLTVWILGLVSLSLNLSSIMIFSLSPLYLTQVFGLAAIYLGIFEGCIEFCSWTMRIFAGVLSDYLCKRKPVLVLSCVMTLLARPLFALASSAGWVYVAKLLDRISNGLQATPREALVGDVSPKELKGTCYGLRHSLGVLGSLLGAAALMYLMRATHNEYKLIFWIASIPPIIALSALLFFVKEPASSSKDPSASKESKAKTSFAGFLKQALQLSSGFWGVICVTGIFMMSNYSGAYRILQAEKLGFPIEDISLIMIAQNLGTMLAAFPVGKLSDRLDRRILLAFGFCMTIASNAFLAFGHGPSSILVSSAFWGAQMGITQSILSTMVADTTPKELRGTGFGIYYFVVACSLFIANMLMGWLANHYGEFSGLVTSMAIAGAGIPLISIMISSRKKKTTGPAIS